MARCGCAQGACFCHFEDTDTVGWTGSGTNSDPATATAKPLLIADDTSTLALDLLVSGSTGTLSAQPIINGHHHVFTADGTWNKPAGVTFARVMMIGGGGGGASGRSGGGSASLGGGGGDAGQVAIFMLTGAEIPASAAVVIGQGGNGGAPEINGNGNVGAAGGNTEFDTRLVRGGAGGRALGLAPTHLAPGMPPGQFAVDYDADWDPAHYYLAPGAGGAGEGFSWSAHPGGYSHPGQGSRYPGDTGGGTAGGGNGRDEPVTKMGGGGGGGAAGADGGNGGLYGGGGGGGGYVSSSALASGAGGDGADGILVVISW
jgi:hypothetical protein